MPITAERMLDIITIASKAVDRVEITRDRIEYITRDIDKIEKRLIQLEINDEIIDQSIASIRALITETETACMIPMSLLRNLGFEKARFEINLSKNKNAKERMQILREGTRTRKFSERKKQGERQEPLALLLSQQDDRDYYKQRGQELHPELGPCDGEPCNKCKALPPNNQTPETKELIIDDGIRYKPAEDSDPSDWKISEGKE
jgi:hypothetical protein